MRGTKTQTSKEEGKEPKNPDITGSMRRCIIEEIPEYLGRKSAKEKKVMARFRCRNEERKQVEITAFEFKTNRQ
jgi:hypothetical protein